MRSLEEAKNYFTYHPPTEDQRFTYERINDAFLGLVEFLWEIIPPENQGSPDKTYALRKLSDARMAANMAVACYVPPPNTEQSSPTHSTGVIPPTFPPPR